MTSQDLRFSKIIPLAASEVDLALRVIGDHECEWLCQVFGPTWARIPSAARRELAKFWCNSPDSGTSGVPSPCIIAWHSPTNHNLGMNMAGVSICFDIVNLEMVRQDPNGTELVSAVIAHELAHSLHIARRQHVRKEQPQVEAEVDAMVIAWGFEGDVRKWIDDHFRIG